MTVTSISAVTLGTTDMARAVAFYRALGFRVAKGGPEAEFTTLEAAARASTSPPRRPRKGDGGGG